MATKWTPARLTPRPQVRVRLVNHLHAVEGLVVAWSDRQLRVRLAWGVTEFWRSDGTHVRQRGPAEGARVVAETLDRVNEYIRAFELSHAPTPVTRPAKSAYALVVWNEYGLAVEGGGKLVRLLVPTGYEPQKTAEELEAIIAWAEARARTSALRSRQCKAAGQKSAASAARRKVVRTRRREPGAT